MKFRILTLFPEMFSGAFSESIVKRAREKGIVEIEFQNIREHGIGKYRQVDDTPYGGGAGMVMRVDVIANALRVAKNELPEGKIVFFSPQGETLTQKKCQEIANFRTPLILLCGHFEGIDERIRELFIDEEISLGDFVLTGGEIPAMALVDAVTRLLPGAVGNEESISDESFSSAFGGRLEYPHYTRPEEFEGLKVPKVLRSGHHAEIETWKMEHLRGFSEEEKNVFDLTRKFFSPEKPWKAHRFLLRKHIVEDLEYWVKWLNDREISEYLPIDVPYTREDAERYFEEKERDFSGFFLTILERESKEPLGSTSLELHGENDHTGVFGIYLGEKETWGKGYGSAIVLEMLKIGFELLDLEKISLRVFQENLAAIKMYERCGFRNVGEARKEVRKKDGFHDVFFMEILRQEWEGQGKKMETAQKFLDLRGEFEI